MAMIINSVHNLIVILINIVIDGGYKCAFKPY